MPLLVYQLTQSAFLTGLRARLEVLPYLVFGLFAGALGDRVDRRRLMIGSDIIDGIFVRQHSGCRVVQRPDHSPHFPRRPLIRYRLCLVRRRKFWRVPARRT